VLPVTLESSNPLVKGHIASAPVRVPVMFFVIRFVTIRFRYNLVVTGHEINIALDIKTMGVTSVAGFRWTR
jgi:hypothetical protein